ncbi:MAG: very short patch repair endonuclease [Armatimonadetes bacterium]|nr:very short patch repair endonuclease [Armatimonadota bacterium]
MSGVEDRPYRYPRRDRRETFIVAEGTRKSMRSNKSRDTSIEMLVRRAAWAAGMRGYRVHSRLVIGRPDMVFSRYKVAVFIHGCYWHGCQSCGRGRIPKTNVSYWTEKIAANQARDRYVAEQLSAQGYRIVVLWECEVLGDLPACVGRLRALLREHP